MPPYVTCKPTTEPSVLTLTQGVVGGYQIVVSMFFNLICYGEKNHPEYQCRMGWEENDHWITIPHGYQCNNFCSSSMNIIFCILKTNNIVSHSNSVESMTITFKNKIYNLWATPLGDARESRHKRWQINGNLKPLT